MKNVVFEEFETQIPKSPKRNKKTILVARKLHIDNRGIFYPSKDDKKYMQEGSASQTLEKVKRALLKSMRNRPKKI